MYNFKLIYVCVCVTKKRQKEAHPNIQPPQVPQYNIIDMINGH